MTTEIPKEALQLRSTIRGTGELELTRVDVPVAAELKTTFASHYTKRVSLAGMLQADAIAEYSKRTTGTKYLVCPQAD